LGDEVATEALPEETDDAILLLRPDQSAFVPGAAEGKERIEFDLIEELKSLGPGPGKKLLLKGSLELLTVSGWRPRLRAPVMQASTASWM